MKIYDCKKWDQDGGVRDESLCYTICDLICHLKGKCQWIMAGLSLLFVLCLAIISNLECRQLSKLSEIYFSVFPSTLGMSIAAYAIVIGFQSEYLKKLLMKDKNNNKPFHVICASMIFNGLLQTMVIISSLAYQIYLVPLLFYISTFLSCYCLLQILDILLQLIGLRTFVIEKE